MNTPKEIKVRVLDEVVTVLDYGKGRFVAKAGGGSLDTEQGKVRHMAELQAIEYLVAAYKRGPKIRANRKNAEKKSKESEKWKQLVRKWVDKHLAQRGNTNTNRHNYSDLARRLLRTGSDFKWPDGQNPVDFDEIRKEIGRHLQNPSK